MTDRIIIGVATAMYSGIGFFFFYLYILYIISFL
jgi:hypothetical protein